MLEWTFLLQIFIICIFAVIMLLVLWALVDTMQAKRHERKLEEIRTENHFKGKHD